MENLGSFEKVVEDNFNELLPKEKKKKRGRPSTKVDANGELIISSKKRKRETDVETEALNLSITKSSKKTKSKTTSKTTPNQAKKAKKSEASFYGQTSLIMHAMGDGPNPLEEAVKKVEADALNYTKRLLRDLRLLSGKTTKGSLSSKITIKDFASYIPETTRVYFRWKAMKGLAKTEPEEVSNSARKGTSLLRQEVEDEEVEFNEHDTETISVHQNEKEVEEEEKDMNGNGGLEEDGFLPPDDEEEQLQLAQLEEEATNRLIEDVQGSGDSSSTALADLSPTIIAFKKRLAFQNSRSRLMTTAQYSIYKAAREASFTNGKGALMKKFAEQFPLPRLTKATLDVVSFLAYDRVGTIVEHAVRANKSKESTGNISMNVDELLVTDYSMLERQLPVLAYETALKVLPSGPLELSTIVDDLKQRVTAATVTQQLKEAREAQNAMSKPIIETKPILGAPLIFEHDVEGDEAFLALL
jgi:hypothetical protein